MKRKYQGSTKLTRAQLQALRSEFEALAKKEGESVNEYFALQTRYLHMEKERKKLL